LLYLALAILKGVELVDACKFPFLFLTHFPTSIDKVKEEPHPCPFDGIHVLKVRYQPKEETTILFPIRRRSGINFDWNLSSLFFLLYFLLLSFVFSCSPRRIRIVCEVQ
jgi:hypothetical protein